MTTHETLSLVLSFRNEEKVLPEFLSRLRAVLGTLAMEHELIFVDDASTDGSSEILLGEARRDPRVKVITMSRRFGSSQCILAGLEHASGAVAIVIETDLQDPPEIIPAMIQKWRAGADVVHTRRIHREGESAMRLFLTHWAYRLIRLFSEEVKMPVDSGNYKLLTRRAMDAVVQLREQDPFFRGLATWVGFKQDELPYRRHQRFAGQSHFPVLHPDSFRDLASGVIAYGALPIRLLFFGEIILAALAVVAAAVTVLLATRGIPISTGSLWSAAILVVVGMQALALALLGLYVGRIYNLVKGRPNYIIDAKVGFTESRRDS
ncbi:MAG: glycosyltransferase family 2 protein [Elusimicrobia bacterium]|nr:glycosyltransferase family 2 protein [Elusimicrobiota bacterium]